MKGPDLVESETRDPPEGKRSWRHALAKSVQRLGAARSLELRNHGRDPATNAGKLGEPPCFDERGEIDVEMLDRGGRALVGAGAERAFAGEREQAGHLAQAPRDGRAG